MERRYNKKNTKLLNHLEASPVSIGSNWAIISGENLVYLGNSRYSTNQTLLRSTRSREGDRRLLARNKWLICLLVYLSSNVVRNLSPSDLTPGTGGWVYVFQFKMHVRTHDSNQNLKHFYILPSASHSYSRQEEKSVAVTICILSAWKP